MSPRITYQQALASGRLARDPGRFKDLAPLVSRGPLGPPPSYLPDRMRELWEERAALMWWLGVEDTDLFRAYVQIVWRMEGCTDRELPKLTGIMIRLRNCMGGRPVGGVGSREDDDM